MTSSDLEDRIHELQVQVTCWAQKHELWTDSCFFKSYQDYFQDEPNEVAACVSILICETGIGHMLNGYSSSNLLSQFDALVESTGFFYESYNHYIYLFYCGDEDLNEKYLDYFEWQWMCELVKQDYTDLYDELFEYFGKYPERMYQLHWRKFEILISEIFRNQGYRTELGKGRDDGGVDVRLYRKDGVDEVVTLVQAKKFKDARPIKLEAVASLSGIVHTEGAANGIFVTTSRFQRAAQKFACNKRSLITLAGKDKIADWCQESKNMIQRDKSMLLSDLGLLDIISKNTFQSAELTGRVVYTTSTYGMMNDFCLVVKDTLNVVLLMQLPVKKIFTDSPYNTKGFEHPVLDHSILAFRKKEHVFRARKNKNGLDLTFYGRHQNYYLWDGQPVMFDYND